MVKALWEIISVDDSTGSNCSKQINMYRYEFIVISKQNKLALVLTMQTVASKTVKHQQQKENCQVNF